jgi:hypothetical protein
VSRPANLSSARVGVPASRTAAGQQVLSSHATLQYLKNSPIRLRGLITGRQYEFSSDRPAQPVDNRDLPGFLRTGLFRQR